MRKIYLLVFVHGFKGSDTTFKQYPWDLQKLVQRELPKVNVLSIQYPQFETRGDLWEAIASFKQWLHKTVSDLEAANHNPDPVDDPSVHVVLVGHSMGGIVSAETLLGITRGEVKARSPKAASPGFSGSEANATMPQLQTSSGDSLDDEDSLAVFFPHIRAILALDTPWLGIAPGVIAFGAEHGWNQAANAWKTVTKTTGKWMGATPAEDERPSARKKRKNSGWAVLGKVVAYTGAATAVAGIAGATYLGWNHLSLGATWVGSHLEFISCLTKGEELKQRLQAVIKLTETRGIGFAQFYVALGEKMCQQTASYTGGMVDGQRTFVYVPPDASSELRTTKPKPSSSRTTSPRSRSPADNPQQPHLADEMEDGDEVEAYANDSRRSKGRWVRCVNDMAGDELTAHRTMFIAPRNPEYFTFLLPQTRDQIVHWVDQAWYETSEPPLPHQHDEHDWKDTEMSQRGSFELD